MSRKLMIAAMAALSALPLARSSAQVSLGVAGGLSLPEGDFGNNVNSGYHVAALVTIAPPLAPAALRLEGGMDQFDYSSTLTNGSRRVLSGTANLVLSSGGIGPYLIGGLGVYRFSADCSTCSTNSTSKVGFNGGAGFNLGLGEMGVLFEARLHFIPSGDTGGSAQFIPLSVGIKF